MQTTKWAVIRRAAGMSIRDVAGETGHARDTISRFERGLFVRSREELETFYLAIRVDVQEALS